MPEKGKRVGNETTLRVVDRDGVLMLSKPAFPGMSWPGKKLPFKTATIHYSIKGIEDAETLFIRDNGKERATYREGFKHDGHDNDQQTIVFAIPEYIYSYDLEKHQGFKVSIRRNI
jgi:hypothetical protein